MERYKRKKGEHIRKEDGNFWKIKIIRQTVICTVIFFSVLGIGFLETQTAENISKNIKKSISYTVDYRSAVEEMYSKITDMARGYADEEKNATDNTN